MTLGDSALTARRAAVLGAAAAAGGMLFPGVASAELSEERKKELYDEEVAKLAAKNSNAQDDETKSKTTLAIISAIVLVSPIIGITGAQKAIATMVENDDDLKAEFKGNDPKIAFQRGRDRQRRR